MAKKLTPGQDIVIIRTVAGSDLGYGHLTRCISLAQALEGQGASPLFIMANPEDGVRDLLRKTGTPLVKLPGGLAHNDDLNALLDFSRKHQTIAIVVDGYQFDENYVNELSTISCCLYIDDLQIMKPNSCLLLNQNPTATPEDYQAMHSQRLLLGLNHAIIDQKYSLFRQNTPRVIHEQGTRLLISFGGSDPNHLCARALQGLAYSRHRYEIKVVAGGGLADSLAATRRAAEASPHKVEVLEWVDDMPVLIAWADMALCGSGVTGYEMCCLGLPMVVVTPVDNQIPVSKGLEDKKLIHHLGWWEGVDGVKMAKAVDDLALDSSERARLAAAGQRAVDGRGAERVARELLKRADAWRACKES